VWSTHTHTHKTRTSSLLCDETDLRRPQLAVTAVTAASPSRALDDVRARVVEKLFMGRELFFNSGDKTAVMSNLMFDGKLISEGDPVSTNVNQTDLAARASFLYKSMSASMLASVPSVGAAARQIRAQR
jgi:hypothetical protein